MKFHEILSYTLIYLNVSESLKFHEHLLAKIKISLEMPRLRKYPYMSQRQKLKNCVGDKQSHCGVLKVQMISVTPAKKKKKLNADNKSCYNKLSHCAIE